MNGDIQGAVALIDSARTVLERNLEKGGGQFEGANYSALGMIYAYLGRKDDAIRAGEKAVEVLPLSKDALLGTFLIHGLAEIYTLVGEHEAAIDKLENILVIPSRISVLVFSELIPIKTILCLDTSFERIFLALGKILQVQQQQLV